MRRGAALSAGAWQRLPRPIVRVVVRVVHSLPTRLTERLRALAARRAYIPPPPPVDVPSSSIRLFIAPANYAGQAWAWARAAERLPAVGARNMATVSGYGFPADCSVPRTVLASRPWQRRQRAAIERFTHVLIEAELPVLPRPGASAGEEIRMLRDRGIRVATVSHGSDIRLPSAHALRDPWSPFRDGRYPEQAQLEGIVERNRVLLEGLRGDDIPAFVSTPDLLLDVPWATWLPVVVDVDEWAGGDAPMERRVPVVVHAPSRATLKGTDLVEPVLHALAAEGRIEYRAAGGLDRAGMREHYRNADIVLDQFRLGIYGVATCEALAAGRVVISHVAEQSRSAAAAASGVELPVIEANGDTLRNTLLDVLANREGPRELAARGPDFVARLHDGRASAAALTRFLDRSAD